MNRTLPVYLVVAVWLVLPQITLQVADAHPKLKMQTLDWDFLWGITGNSILTMEGGERTTQVSNKGYPDTAVYGISTILLDMEQLSGNRKNTCMYFCWIEQDFSQKTKAG